MPINLSSHDYSQFETEVLMLAESGATKEEIKDAIDVIFERYSI